MHVYADAKTSEQLSQLRYERKKLGYSPKILSAMLGIAYNRYMQYETGYRLPPVKLYLEIAEILGWDIKDNPNRLYQLEDEIRKLRLSKKKYGYTNEELSQRTGVTKGCIARFFSKKKERTPQVFALLKQALEEAQRAERLRNEILGVKERTPQKNFPKKK